MRNCSSFIACGRDVSDLANTNELIEEPTNYDLTTKYDYPSTARVETKR
jgi:hypothetical protein